MHAREECERLHDLLHPAPRHGRAKMEDNGDALRQVLTTGEFAQLQAARGPRLQLGEVRNDRHRAHSVPSFEIASNHGTHGNVGVGARHVTPLDQHVESPEEAAIEPTAAAWLAAQPEFVSVQDEWDVEPSCDARYRQERVTVVGVKNMGTGGGKHPLEAAQVKEEPNATKSS